MCAINKNRPLILGMIARRVFKTLLFCPSVKIRRVRYVKYTGEFFKGGRMLRHYPNTDEKDRRQGKR